MAIGVGMGLDQAIALKSNSDENMLLLVNADPINKTYQVLEWQNGFLYEYAFPLGASTFHSEVTVQHSH